ncbi:NAD(P)-binding domain-containing protein [Aneurinibacillus sp. REN35]|uniref:NAD(P)-binding domain-containing protein n=1 Tax=Aneurinibacillus sp. REN35 TaxID=3237286 RepID=UPI003526C507
MDTASCTWAIVGIGRLGQALLTRFQETNFSLGIYHPDIQKSEACAQAYSHHNILSKGQLVRTDIIILALPAQQIEPFIDELLPHLTETPSPLFINMATTASTAHLRQHYPSLAWASMKFMGQADVLRENGNGLFVTEEITPSDDIRNITVLHTFSLIGHVTSDQESTVEEVNRMATYYAIKAAKELEIAMRERGFAELYQKRALTSLIPGVIRSYAENTLGHFGKSVARQFDNSQSKN